MVWRAEDPYIAESKKIVWEVALYLRGRGLDIGAGDFKVLPHAISVDNMHHSQFGFSVKPDVMSEATDLSVFGTHTMDFVYSSHTLEHIEDYPKALKEWWRLVKHGGYMILYLPDEDEYPKVGTPGANPDHKWDVNYDKVVAAMEQMRGWDLIDFQKRNADDEYSLLFVFKKTNTRYHGFTWVNTKPGKTACVVRYGAYGDLMQASSVWAGLKQQGYHVTVFASRPGSDAIEHDPNIDNLVLFDKDQVPNANLVDFWGYQRNKFDKFVNLSESVEGTFLAMPGRAVHAWPPAVRHRVMDFNYLEVAHQLAGVPHVPQVKFYATENEKNWARKQRNKMRELVVMWSLAGSSVHKTWAGLDHILGSLMSYWPEVEVVLVGGPECVILESGWENEPRIHKTSGKWSIRQSLAFLAECDLVIGSETGVLNAAACMELPKVTLLSHSTHENLTRDWKNVIPIASADTRCPGRGEDSAAPACHQLHYGWTHCKQDAETGTAQCQADISVEKVWREVEFSLQQTLEKKQKVA